MDDFPDFDDELFLEFNNRKRCGKNDETATPREQRKLYHHIGAFELWTFLPVELQKHVVKYLYYSTRIYLSLCSKADYEVVQSTPFELDFVAVTAMEEIPMEDGRRLEVSIKIQAEFDRGDGITENQTTVFFKNGNGMRRPSIVHDKNHRMFIEGTYFKENCNYLTEAENYIEKFLRFCHVGEFQCNILDRKMNLRNLSMIRGCNSAQMSNADPNMFKPWLEKLKLNMTILFLDVGEAKDHDQLPVIERDILDLPQIQTAKQIIIIFKCPYTDDEFLRTKIPSFSFVSEYITDEAINDFISRWVNSPDHEFRQFHLDIFNRRVNADEVLRGLGAKAWDFEFINCVGRVAHYLEHGDCYQVAKRGKIRMSATICISEQAVDFLVTGRPNKDGQISYSFAN